MKIDGKSYRTIWVNDDEWSVSIIDQTLLPHRFETRTLSTIDDAAEAIVTMRVRGAPLIGATAAYGLCLGLRHDNGDDALKRFYEVLHATRPTAINLKWALDDMMSVLMPAEPGDRVRLAYDRAAQICDDDVATCRSIGEQGLRLLQEISERKKGETVNVLTHCNAGWLACVDWGTALAPIYLAHDSGISVHVWVDETRPRNQGAALTAYELGAHGVPHTVIVDNAGGHLMQRGQVDLCFVGTDRTAANGDVANKIGTYLKALAAHDNDVPFYVTLPHSTIDWTVHDGVTEIPIEERSGDEVTKLWGRTEQGDVQNFEIAAPGSNAANPAFDVTPARLVTGLVTERGVAEASAEGLLGLYPERRQ